jgi:SHS2 domain-containing protein
MPISTAGYREIEHTADWELEVWAPDLLALLEQAARGMYALSGTRLEMGAPVTRTIELNASDPESLLVTFLGELLFLIESENLAFQQFNLHLEGKKLSARMEGAQINSRGKEIKAVTYHNLNVRQTRRGLEARIVLDV